MELQLGTKPQWNKKHWLCRSGLGEEEQKTGQVSSSTVQHLKHKYSPQLNYLMPPEGLTTEENRIQVSFLVLFIYGSHCCKSNYPVRGCILPADEEIWEKFLNMRHKKNYYKIVKLESLLGLLAKTKCRK